MSPPMRGRGLKPLGRTAAGRFEAVAPHAGAWIETHHGIIFLEVWRSPPMRGRGLKQINHEK